MSHPTQICQFSCNQCCDGQDSQGDLVEERIGSLFKWNLEEVKQVFHVHIHVCVLMEWSQSWY